MLRSWTGNFSHEDKERWVCIYPAYINSKKTRAEGRKIAREFGVENPKLDEMKDVMATSGLNYFPENKAYPRERDAVEMRFRGRIRVQLRDIEGENVSEKFQDRESIMRFLGETIPKLKTRQGQAVGGASAAGGSQDSAGQKKGKQKKKK